MTFELSWFFDAFVVAVLLVFLYVGGKRGLLKSVVYVVLLIAAFLVSWFAAEAVAPMIYDNFIKDKVIAAFASSTQSSDPADIVSQAVSEGEYGVEMTQNEISSLISGASDFFTDLASEMKENGAKDAEGDIKAGVEESVKPKVINALFADNEIISSEYVLNALSVVGGGAEKIADVVDVFITGTKDQTARAAEETLVAPAVKWLLRALIFILAMFILRLIISPVADVFKFANRIPVIGPVNALLGGVLGVAQGLLFLYIAALVVKVIINVSGNSLMFFNTQTIEKTKLFIHFYLFRLNG